MRDVTATLSTGSDVRYATRQVGRGAEHYYLKEVGIAGEPPGVWLGRGAEDLGLSGEVKESVAEQVYGFEHPQTGERLGSKPRTYASYGERLDKALSAEPHADAKRVAQIRMAVSRGTRENVAFYDLTFSAPKSWSVLHAGLQVNASAARAAGRVEEAARWEAQAGQVWEAWMDGVRAGLEYMQETAGEARVGRHGPKTADGSSSGRYVDAPDWTIAAFRQHTSRDNDPQLHVHCLILNRVKTREVDPVTGQAREAWRALNGQALYRHRPAAGAISERVAEESLSRRLGAVLATRPDGKAREIVGISAEMREEFSSRTKAIATRVAEKVCEYEQRHGRPPSVKVLATISQEATMATRRGKTKAQPREQLLSRWDAQATRSMRESLAAVPQRVLGRAGRGRAPQPEVFHPEKVIAAAVATVQEKKATWSRPELITELNRALPDCLGGLSGAQVRGLLDELADAAVRPGGPGGVVCVTAPEAVPVPEAAQRRDGRSRWTARGVERYTTEEQLRREGRILEAAATPGAGPAVPARAVDAVIAGKTLTGAQAEAVRGIATSGRRVDVLIGPAGTGKSYTIAALCEAWERGGGQVLGLAASQRAADVLREEGIDRVANISMLLKAQEQLAKGKPVHDADLYRIRPGQLVIVDEASMAPTNDLDQVVELAERAGAKVLQAGDHQQLTAVGAGGMLKLLAEDLEHVYTLDAPVRFREPDGSVRTWEAEASLRIRAGDAEALVDYDRRGRIFEGTGEEMRRAAYQGWLSDHLAGKDSLLIVATNDDAAELGARARADLVRFGQVAEHGVPLQGGRYPGYVAGVGDLVALRRNDRTIVSTQGAEGAHWAVNREVVRVVGVDDAGRLAVRYDDGAQMLLPADYVAEHVDLAYAGTFHSVEGRTVKIGRELVDRSTSREEFYVGLTRGTAANYAYVSTGSAPSELQNPERTAAHEAQLDRWAVLADVLERVGAEDSATAVVRAELDRVDSLAVLAHRWSEMVAEDAERRHGAALRQTLSEEDFTRLQGEEDGKPYANLLRLARHAEEQGHDGGRLLEQAVVSRSLVGADSVGAVLFSRLERRLETEEASARRQVQRSGPAAGGDLAAPRWRSYTERTPAMAGHPLGEYAHLVAEAMDARVATLGERAAAQAPAWALERLGPVPGEPLGRAEWTARAGVVAAYREAHGYQPDHDAIGPAPGRGAVDARVAWEQAYQALGAPADQVDVAAASDARLRELVERHDREIAWAPPFAESEQREAHQAAEAYRVQTEITRAQAQAAQSPQRSDLEARAGDYEQLAGLHAARAAKLDQVAEAYDRWHAHTEPARLAAEAARTELDRRHRTRGGEVESTRAPDPWAGRGRTAAREYDQPDLDMRQEQAAEYARTHPLDGQLQLNLPTDQLTAAQAAKQTADREADRPQQHDQDHAAGRQVDPTPESAAQIARDRKPAPEQAPEPARQISSEQEELDLDLPERRPESRLTGAQIDQALHAADTAEKVLTERATEARQEPEQEAAELDRRVDYQQQQETEQARTAEREAPQIVADH
jgi:conjugative relaxase-like TrwC/TraI family protein